MSSESITLTDDLFFNELYIFANEINRGFVSGSLVVCESNDREDTIILKLQDGFRGHDSNKYDKYIIYTLNDKRTLLINFKRLWKEGDFLEIKYPREVSELLLTENTLDVKIQELPERPQTGVTPTIITLPKGRVVDVSTLKEEGDFYRLRSGDKVQLLEKMGQGKKVRVTRKRVISIKEMIEEPEDCTGEFYNTAKDGSYSFFLSNIILPKIVSKDRTYLIKTNDNLTFTGKFENINTKKKVLHTSGNLFFYFKKKDEEQEDELRKLDEVEKEEIREEEELVQGHLDKILEQQEVSVQEEQNIDSEEEDRTLNDDLNNGDGVVRNEISDPEKHPETDSEEEDDINDEIKEFKKKIDEEQEKSERKKKRYQKNIENMVRTNEKQEGLNEDPKTDLNNDETNKTEGDNESEKEKQRKIEEEKRKIEEEQGKIEEEENEFKKREKILQSKLNKMILKQQDNMRRAEEKRKEEEMPEQVPEEPVEPDPEEVVLEPVEPVEPVEPDPKQPEPEEDLKEEVEKAINILKYQESGEDIKKSYWVYRFAMFSLGLMIYGLTKENNSYDIFKFIDNDFNSFNNSFKLLLNDIQNENLKELLNKFYQIQIFSNVEPTKIISYFLTEYHKILKEEEEGITEEGYSINKLLEQLDKFQREYVMSFLNVQYELEDVLGLGERINEVSGGDRGGNKKRKKFTKKRYKKLSTNLRIPKSIKKKKQIGGKDFNITKFIKYKPQKRELNSSEYIEEICHEYERSLGTVELQVTKINEDNKEYMCVSLNEKLIRMKNFFILKRKNPGKDRYCLVYTNKNNLTLGFYKIGAHNFFSGDLNGDGENNLIITQILDPRLRERFFFKIEFLKEHLKNDLYLTLFSKDYLEDSEIGDLERWEKEIKDIDPYDVTSEEVPNKSYVFFSISSFYDILKYRRRREQSGGQIPDNLFGTKSVHNTVLHGSIPIDNVEKSKYRLEKIDLTEDKEDLLSLKINETKYKQQQISTKEGNRLRKGVIDPNDYKRRLPREPSVQRYIEFALSRLMSNPTKETKKTRFRATQFEKGILKGKKKGSIVTLRRRRARIRQNSLQDYVLEDDYSDEKNPVLIEAEPQTSYFSKAKRNSVFPRNTKKNSSILKPKEYSPLVQRYPESIEHTGRFDGVFFWKLKEFDYFRFKYKNYQYLCLTTNYKTDQKTHLDNCSEKRFYLKNEHSQFFCRPEDKKIKKANRPRKMSGEDTKTMTFPTDFVTSLNMTSNNRMGRDRDLNDVESENLFRKEIIIQDLSNIRKWLEREKTLCKQKDKILEEIEDWYRFEVIPDRFKEHDIVRSSPQLTLEKKLRVQEKYDYNFSCLISLRELNWAMMGEDINNLRGKYLRDIYGDLVKPLYGDKKHPRSKTNKVIIDFLKIKKNNETLSVRVYYKEFSFEYFNTRYDNMNPSDDGSFNFDKVINTVKSCLLSLNFPYRFINKHIKELRLYGKDPNISNKVYFFYIMGKFMSCKFFYENDIEIKGKESPYLDIDLILNTSGIYKLFDGTTNLKILEVSLTPVIDNKKENELNTSRLELYIPLSITNYLRKRACETPNESIYNKHRNKEVLEVLFERKKKLQEKAKKS